MLLQKPISASGSLAGEVVLPCHFSTPISTSTSPTPAPSQDLQQDPDSPGSPAPGTAAPLAQNPDQLRIKWTRLEGLEEQVVLVAHGGVLKVGQQFKGRVSVPSHAGSVGDASLTMVRLRASDAGLYRCEVMRGMDDSQDTVSLSVSGEYLKRSVRRQSPWKRYVRTHARQGRCVICATMCDYYYYDVVLRCQPATSLTARCPLGSGGSPLSKSSENLD